MQLRNSLGHGTALGLGGSVCLAANNHLPAEMPMVQFANKTHMKNTPNTE